MKRIISTFLVVFLSFSSSFAQEGSITFDEARVKAIQNSEKLKIQQEIIDSLIEKEKLQKENPHINNPDYEYDGITKTEVYNNSYKSYDYTDLLKSAKQTKKDMIIANEQKTMTLFSNVINSENAIDAKNTDIINQQTIVNQAKAKFKAGKIIKLELENEEILLENLNSSLETLKNQLELNKKKLNYHLNISDKENISLSLTEPKLDMLLPQDLISQNMKNDKAFKDLNEDLKELNDDMKWIDLLSTGVDYRKNTDAQQKLIDEKQKDIEQFKKDKLYKYDKLYYQILLKANNISLDKIKKVSLDMKKAKLNILYSKGLITKNEIDKLDSAIEKNILEQNKKQLEIRAMILNYEQ